MGSISNGKRSDIMDELTEISRTHFQRCSECGSFTPTELWESTSNCEWEICPVCGTDICGIPVTEYQTKDGMVVLEERE